MQKNQLSYIVTAVIAIMAITLGIIALSMTRRESSPLTVEEQVYTPSVETAGEMKKAAVELISLDYTVVSLFVADGPEWVDDGKGNMIQHLPEPYGNPPESGYYLVASDKYKTLADTDELVRSAVLSSAAEKFISDPAGTGPVFADRDGRLAISEQFQPAADYPYDWERPSYKLTALSDDEFELVVTLNLTGGIGTKEFTRTVTRTSAGWRLNALIV